MTQKVGQRKRSIRGFFVERQHRTRIDTPILRVYKDVPVCIFSKKKLGLFYSIFNITKNYGPFMALFDCLCSIQDEIEIKLYGRRISRKRLFKKKRLQRSKFLLGNPEIPLYNIQYTARAVGVGRTTLWKWSLLGIIPPASYSSGKSHKKYSDDYILRLYNGLKFFRDHNKVFRVEKFRAYIHSNWHVLNRVETMREENRIVLATEIVGKAKDKYND